MSSWFTLTVLTPNNHAERLSSLMFELGSSGIETDDSVPGAVSRLVGYFPEQVDRVSASERIRDLLDEMGAGELESPATDVPDEDWSAGWREHFEPIWPTPRMVIHPPWHAVDPPEDGFAVVIEPRTAFGTGSHPTTRMALASLERAIRGGEQVLDVGTGSGILGIAAVRLGAHSVTAVDTDPMSTDNVAENVALNGVSGIEVETRAVTADDSGFDVTVANIISSVLTPMLPILASSVVPGGCVILGGLLDREESQFVPRVEKAGLDVVEVTREAEWIGLMTRTRA